MTLRDRLALVAIPVAFLAGEFAAAPLGPPFAEPNPRAFAAIAVGIAVASCAHLALVRGGRAIPRRALLAVTAATLLVALATPLHFSADVRAYAAYGELLLHGIAPRPLGPADAALGPCVAAALADWNGRLPADVYGPLFRVVAAGAVALTGHAPDAARLLLRVLAACAWFGVVLVLTRRGARGAVAVATHPVALWTVAEGHNDAFFLLPLALGFAAARPRAAAGWLAVAACVKPVALVPLAALRPLLAALAGAAAYAPLLPLALAPKPAPGVPRIAPLPVLLHAAPGWPVAGLLIGAALILAWRARRCDAAGAAALAAWTVAPVVYPWYGTWLLPLVARDPATPVNRALLVASLTAFAGYAQDAVTPGGGGAFSVGVMFVQFGLPLVVLGLALAQATPAPQPLPAPQVPASPASPAALPTPLPPATPAALPTPLPPATPAPTASPAPQASGSPYAFIVDPTPAPDAAPGAPRILQIAVIDRVIHAGGALLARITTSPDANSVVARVMGQQLQLGPTSPGVFMLDAHVPGAIPFWYFREYEVEIVASKPDGTNASARVKLRLTR